MKSVIKSVIKPVVKKIMPTVLWEKFAEYMNKIKRHKLKLEIIKYLETNSAYDNPEKGEIISFLKSNSSFIFPYNFIKKYDARNIRVYTDNQHGMKYVLHENKRLYFKKNWNEKLIMNSYNGLLIEQDIDSPHRYETSGFHVNTGDVVVDVGVAEGNFALSVVEKAKKLYLFEVDEEWIDVLKVTFAPWKEKVEIICKYVSDHDDDENVTLDTFLGKEKVDFIKADIEGAETALLKGCKNILSDNHPLKIVMCTYHNPNDAEEIKHMLTGSGFQTVFSKGYMIFIYDETLCAPYLRKGLIRGIKI